MQFQTKEYSPRPKNKKTNKEIVDPYDTLFNLIFVMQRVKSGARRKKLGNYYDASSKTSLSGLMANVAEIGLQPAIFPYRMMLDNLSKQIDSLIEIKDDVSKDPRFDTSNTKFTLGLSSIFTLLGNPRAFIRQGFVKYKADRDFARMGGAISRSIDAAIFTLWAKELGASTREAVNIGKLYGDDLHPDFLAESKKQLFNRVVSVSASAVATRMGVNAQVVKDAIQSSYKSNDKVERKQILDRELSSAGLEQNKRKLIAEQIYGADKEVKKDATDEGKVQKEEEKETMGIWVNLDQDKNLYELRKIGQRQALVDLASRITTQNSKSTNRSHKIVLQKLKDLASGKKVTTGQRVGQMIINFQFLKSGIVGSEFSKNLLSGRFDKLKISQYKDYPVFFGEEPKLDANGKPKNVSIMEGKDGVVGHIFGSAYYLHPINLFNGLFVNGELWLKMAKKNGRINGKSLPYFIYNMMPRQLLAPVKGFTQNAFSKIFGKVITSSMKTAFKSGVKSVLAFIFGAIPAGGIMVQLLFDKVIDYAAEFAMQILVFVFLALAAYVIVAVDGLTTYIDQLKPDQTTVVKSASDL